MSDDSEKIAIAEMANDVKWIRQEMERGRSKLDLHDKRIGALETWKYLVTTIATLAAGVFGLGRRGGRGCCCLLRHDVASRVGFGSRRPTACPWRAGASSPG